MRAPPEPVDSGEIARFAADLTRALGAPARDPLLLAVSGGPDSMAMLVLAAGAGIAVRVASIDHGLRAEAADEAALVAAHCATLGLAHATLRPATRIAGASVQAQARVARYALLADHARGIGAAAILTAHHADDQAETFLMRAARGVGLAGLAGVRTRTVIAGASVVRPLLEWRRAELRAIVRRGEVPFVDDPSNRDDRHDRTRFRKLLDANEWLGPPQLARSAGQLADADADVRAMVDWFWTTRAAVAGDEVRIDAEGLPRELLRRLARRGITAVRESGGIATPAWSDAANVEPLLDALIGGSRVTQGGVVVTPRQAIWRFRPAPPRRSR